MQGSWVGNKGELKTVMSLRLLVLTISISLQKNNLWPCHERKASLILERPKTQGVQMNILTNYCTKQDDHTSGFPGTGQLCLLAQRHYIIAPSLFNRTHFQ